MNLQENLEYGVAGCCAMAYVYGFDYDKNIVDKPLTRQKHMTKFLEAAIEGAEDQGKSILFATICDLQLIAEQSLIAAGFTSSFPDWAERNPKRSGYVTKVKVYMKLLYTPTKAEEV